MIDIVLLVVRIAIIVLLYVFLFALMKTGIGLVRGQRGKEKAWEICVESGPKELRGVRMAVRGPTIVGRSPGADIVIGAGYVSGRHARFDVKGSNLFVEDLGSTNGTMVNGNAIVAPQALKAMDVVSVGDVNIRVRKQKR